MIFKVYSYTPFKADGKLMFGCTHADSWKKLYPANNEGMCNWALRSLLIDDGQNIVLIDTGFNDYNPEVLEEYKIKDFRQASELIDYEKPINIVIHTHLHLDHCGGSFLKTNENFNAAFKDAYYYVSENNFNIAIGPSEFEKSSFQPEIVDAFKYYKNLKLINSNYYLLPWLELKMYNGHTKGLLMPVIHFKNKTIAFVGDLIPSVAHLELNSISGYDIDPDLSEIERQTFLKEAYVNQYILFFQHDLKNECCTIDFDGKNYKAHRKFCLQSLESF